MTLGDLHLHVGQSLNGKAVKITASSAMTLPKILRYSLQVKGLELIGIVDSHSVGVRQDYQDLLADGLITPLAGGGYSFGRLAIIPGLETELKVGEGHAHFLAYFPSIPHLETFLRQVKPYGRNWQLSSQKLYLDMVEWTSRVEEAEGFWLPAHVFTPHKGIYGNCCARLKDVMVNLPKALEIGLSADRNMASSVSEIDGMQLFSNSDAHSLPNIAREYNDLELEENSFAGLKNLICEQRGRLVQNYGLPPQMGKYHRSYCLQCSKVLDGEPPIAHCPDCGSSKIVLGVLDRLTMIADRPICWDQKDDRYTYRVPLRLLPGIGPKMYSRLLKKYGTELAVYHHDDLEDDTSLVGEKIARILNDARKGKLEFTSGGGGYFGKVLTYQT